MTRKKQRFRYIVKPLPYTVTLWAESKAEGRKKVLEDAPTHAKVSPGKLLGENEPW